MPHTFHPNIEMRLLRNSEIAERAPKRVCDAFHRESFGLADSGRTTQMQLSLFAFTVQRAVIRLALHGEIYMCFVLTELEAHL